MKAHMLEGKRALVTGASSGIGAEIARELGRAGCNLVLAARRREKLEELRDEITGKSGGKVQVEIVAVDLADPGSAGRLHGMLEGEGKSVDVLVNNAGFGTFGPFASVPWEREHEQLQLDVVTLVHLTKLFVPAMVKRGFGRILQVASIGAFLPTPGYATYCASKTFVLHFGEALNHELTGTGVRCTVLSPGATATGFFEVAGQKPGLYHRLLMMPADRTARIGIRAMLAGRSSVVAGWANKIATWSMRFMPRRILTAMAALVSR